MARKTSSLSPRRNKGLARLLAGVSMGAASLMLAAMPSAVRAQAVNGDYTIQFGIETVTRDSVTKTDTVLVTANEALLDWNATDTGGVFLPEGATLAFTRGSQPYTVLNRVTSSAAAGPLSIAGTVSSGAGGKVWFYNPGGWVVGETGVFNVGSLVLTSLPITVDPATDTVSRLLGDKGEIRFGAALDPKSSIAIASGARISATQGAGSYVAMVAPKVSQAGSVTVRGSTAYVAAEAATMTIRNGLFDIVVDSGSEDTTGVSHTGSTTGPAGVTGDTVRRIYVVAVPKNQAMTAMVAGSLGYTAAASASEVNGSIILSAGQNVSGNTIVADSAGSTNASLAINGLAASNAVTARASGGVTIDATSADVTFARSADIAARRDIVATVDNGHVLSTGGALTLRSANGAAGGNVTLSASRDSTISVAGDLTLESEAVGAIQTDPGNGDALLAGSSGENATSGNVALTVTDSSISALTTYLRSSATSGVGELSNGNATAGAVTVDVTRAAGVASLRTADLGTVFLDSVATNGVFGPQFPQVTGSSRSANVRLSVSGGNFSAAGIRAYSEAYSYPALMPVARDATTGSVLLSFANANSTFQTGRIEIANYGSASNGGVVSMGNVELAAANAAVTTSDASGTVDLGSYAFGNFETANTVAINLSAGASLDSRGFYVALAGDGSGATSFQHAANTAVTLDSATLTTPELYLSNRAQAFGSGVDAIGGGLTLSLTNGADLQGGLVQLTSFAQGGGGEDGGSGTGGDAAITIGDSRFSGTLSVDTTGVVGRRNGATGRSGVGRGGGISFDQYGGNAVFNADQVTLTSLGLGGSLNFGARVSTLGQDGDGGAAFGGAVSVTVSGGSLSVGTDTGGGKFKFASTIPSGLPAAFAIRSDAEGGDANNVDGGPPANGGSATGGTASFTVSGGNLDIASLSISASGIGGNGAPVSDEFGVNGGNGGAGTGGSASLNVLGGTLRTDGLLIEANGNKSQPNDGGTEYYGNGGFGSYYGSSNSSTGSGGTGTGGSALLLIDGGILGVTGAAVNAPPAVQVRAIGEGGYAYSNVAAGGTSGTGGTGIGGSAQVRFLSGEFDLPVVTVDASGLGGSAGRQGYTPSSAASGGSATGGNASFEIGTDFDELTSNDDTRVISLVADGIGRGGEDGEIGGLGGNGRGGTARLSITGGSVTIADASISAMGIGGFGGSSDDGATGGRGGAGTGGTARLTVSGDGTLGEARDVRFDVSGRGGFGGSGGDGSDTVAEAGNGGLGGNGSGGTVELSASGGQLTLSTFSDGSVIAASGLGGRGGDGGNSAAFGHDVVGNGGTGGIGRGGSIRISADVGMIDLGVLDLAAVGTGGNGGERDFTDTAGDTLQSIGGTGGAGYGGTIELFADSAGTLLATELFARAEGQGGRGADGFGYAADGAGTSGSAGGDGFGGDISLGAAFAGTVDFANANAMTLVSQGLGGVGGNGVSARADSGGAGGNGGDGGFATGGFIGVSATSEGTVSLALSGTTSLVANGSGGLSGNGGDGASTTTPNAFGGAAGNAGIGGGGRGGSIAFSAGGGYITAGAIDARARGISNANQVLAMPGTGPAGFGAFPGVSLVAPAGGTIMFSSSDGDSTTGSFVAGATVADVTGEVVFNAPLNPFSLLETPGSIAIRNASTATEDGLRFASFTGQGRSDSGIGEGSGISIDAVSGPVTIDNDLVLEAGGPIFLTMASGADIAVGGLARFFTGSGLAITGTGSGKLAAQNIDAFSFGEINVTSLDCPDSSCAVVSAGSSLSFDAGSDVHLVGSSVVEGLGSLDVYSFGQITGDTGSGYRSNGSVLVRAAGNATIRNATGANLDLEAGAVVDGGTIYYDGLLTLGEAEGGGVFQGSQLAFLSGGSIDILGSNTFTSTGGINVRSGNDILVGEASHFIGNNSLDGEGSAVTFSAGGLGISYDLASGDIPALRFAQGASVDAGVGSINLYGAAIDARLAQFAGSNFRADISQRPAFGGPRGDDGGQLDADCLEGAICVGAIDVSGSVLIGASEGVPIDVRATGPIHGSTVRIAALGDITIGNSGSVVDVLGDTLIDVSSRFGNIALTGGSGLKADQVRLSAIAGFLTGNGRVEATGDDIGLTFAGDIAADALIAEREITSATAAGGEVEGSFSTPGALRVGLVRLDSPIAISTGTDIAIGTLGLSGLSATLTAGTTLSLGTLEQVNDLSLVAGDGATLGMLSVLRNLSVEADTLTATSLNAPGALAITTTGAADLGASTGTAGLSVTTGNLAFTSLGSGGAIVVKAGDVTGGSVTTAGSISLESSGATSLAAATAGTSLDITAKALTAPLLKAGGGITINVTDAARLGTVDAGGPIKIDPVLLTFDVIKSPGDVDLAGGTITGGTVTAGGGVTVAASGDAAFDVITAGTAVTLSTARLTAKTVSAKTGLNILATGAVSLGDAVAGGDLRVETGGALTYGTLDGGTLFLRAGSGQGGNLRSRTGEVNLSATGDVTVGQVSSAGLVGIDGSDLRYASIDAVGDIGLSGRSITGGAIKAGQDVSLSSVADLELADITARNANFFSRGVINLSGLRLGGTVGATAQAVGLKAEGDLALRGVIASNGNVSASATGALRANQVTATGDITLASSGADVVVGLLSAGRPLQGQQAVAGAGTVVAGVVGRGDVLIDAARDVAIDGTVDAARALTVAAANEIRINALATAATIDLASSQIAIGATGQVGESARTDSVTLANSGQGVTLVGDNIPSQTSGYALSQAEFARIRSRGSLTIQGSGPMLVGDLAATAKAGTVAGQVGETGTLSLRSSGLVSLLGSTTLANAGGNTLAITGGAGIYLDAATGSVRLSDGTARAGTLVLSGDGIAMVTRGALADIANLTGTAAITDRLSRNDGVTADRTLVEADSVQLRSDRTIYIQNTSASTDFAARRGLVANSLRLGTRDGGSLDIVINGVVNGATGVDAISLTTIDSGFSDLSSINGCVIRNASACLAQPEEPTTTANVEVRDAIEEVLDKDPSETAVQVVDSFARTTLIQLNQIAPAGFEPLIDEPVTGTGNDDLLDAVKRNRE